MTAQKEDDNRLLLERLAILLEERNTFNSNFLKGIAEGEVSEYEFRDLISPPGTPQKWSENKYGLKILINPDNYLERKEYKYFNEDFDNDFDEILEEVNQLNKILNKSFSRVIVKPKINDNTFLSVMGEIIRSRNKRNMLFEPKFLDGFSKGEWKLNQKEEPKTLHPYGLQHNQTTSTVTIVELIIFLPFDYFQHKKNDIDTTYIHKVVEEIKHFPDEITRVHVKPL